MNTEKQEYRVLARKYRPQTFNDLKGQDILVQILSNAITSGESSTTAMKDSTETDQF